MKAQSNIDQVMQQTQRYWYEDGFQDMAFGGFILAIALLFGAQTLTPPGSPLWMLWGLGGPLLLIGGAVVASAVVRRLKERVTYPRTGYVAYERARGKSRLVRMGLAFVISAGISAGIVVLQKNWVSLPVILGFVYMATFSFLAFRFGLRRYVFMAFWCLALGLSLASLSLTIELAGAIYHVGTGVALIVAGWFTWRQYDQNAPKGLETNDDEKLR
ncbi:MAG: hypothetical protein HZB51_17630 [Chloroflexi bacterium]|nr:hypothetical protein [Chloroflexota bacterium]